MTKISSWTKNPQFKQHFAATFISLTHKMMVLVCRSTFLVHFAMLAPKFHLLLNNVHPNFNALQVMHCHHALVLVQTPLDSGNVCKNPLSTTLLMVFNITHYLGITSTMDLISYEEKSKLVIWTLHNMDTFT
jgi:hypothetical protein